MADNIIDVLSACLSQPPVEELTGSDVGYNPMPDDSEVSRHLKEIYDKENTILRLNRLIRKTIDYIGKVVIFNEEEVVLSWHHVEPYLNAQTPDGDHLYSYITAIFSMESVPHFVTGDPVCKVKFKQQQDLYANAFIGFLNYILPHNNINYPKICKGEVLLTTAQYFFCTQYAPDSTGNLSQWCVVDRLLKTLRADEFDFSHQFILGIIPGDNGRRRLHNLRPSNRQLYTITPDRSIRERLNKYPLHTPEKKKGFSQVQSSTLIDDERLSYAFGFTKDRNSKLYGLVTDLDDALITRLLVEDYGTVTRPFDHADSNSAFSSEAYRIAFYPKDQLKEFKEKNKLERKRSQRTNEVLARLRFNPYKSVVCICSDTLEARLLAYDFAQELLEHYTTYAEKIGVTVNPNFKIPIIFYTPDTNNNGIPGSFRHEIKLYTVAMRQKDLAEALAIFNNNKLRPKYYADRNYEFLLGLPKKALRSALFVCVCCGKNCGGFRPLVLDMIVNGYARMLSRLLRSSRHDGAKRDDAGTPSLGDEIVEFLVSKQYVVMNAPIISKLILIEEFDLADQFITATQSDKLQLPLDKGLLVNHLIKLGNPRQLSYMGLDTVLPMAAREKAWVGVKLCLKEYPDLSPLLLRKILAYACQFGEPTIVKYLLRKGVDTKRLDGNAPISLAASAGRWDIVRLFTDYPTDAEDQSEYGYAMLQTIYQGGGIELTKLLLKSGAKPTWRRQGHKGYELRSTLWFALLPTLAREFKTLLPQLIEHENHHRDEYSSTRYLLALNLAQDIGNQDSIARLEAEFATTTRIAPANIEANICQWVLDVLAISGSPLAENMAERVLLRYCYQYRLLEPFNEQNSFSTRVKISLFNNKPLTQNRNQTAAGLQIIMPYFYATLKTVPTGCLHDVLRDIVLLLMEHNEPSLFRYFTDLSALDVDADPHPDELAKRISLKAKIRTYVIKTMLSKLSQDRLSFVQTVVKHHFTLTAETIHTESNLWVGSWLDGLNNAFADSVKEAADKALLLYQLGPNLPENLAVEFFNCAISKGGMNIVRDLISNPVYAQPLKEKMAVIAIEWLDSDAEILAMMKNNIEVTAGHVRKATICLRKELLLSFLDIIDKNKYATPEYQWSFYTAFHFYAFGDLVVEKKLIGLLGAPMIRHFTLICLLIALQATATFKSHKENWPNIAKYYDENNLSRYNIILFDTKDKVSEYDQKLLLSTLNDYFVDVGTVPKEDITAGTYKKILGIVASALGGADAFRFKVGSPPQFQLPNRVYRTMKQLDRLLSESDLALTTVGNSNGR